MHITSGTRPRREIEFEVQTNGPAGLSDQPRSREQADALRSLQIITSQNAILEAN